MPWWSQLTWDIARAGGFVAYGLLTLAIVTGVLHSLKWGGERWPRLVNNEVHTHLTLLALVFTVVHVVAVSLDPFTAFHLNELLLPLVSHYRPLWMAFGIVALYLGIAVGISTWVRPKIGYRAWRYIHFATFASFVFATIHGLGTGSDSKTTWALAIYGVASLAVGGLTIARLVGSKMSPRLRLAGGALAAFLLVGGLAWASAGPLHPGWNTVANNGRGSGARVQLGTPTTASKGTPATLQPLAAAFAGSYQVRRGGDDGNVEVLVQASLQNGAAGTFDLMLTGFDQGGSLAIQSSRVQISEAAPSQVVYAGQITGSQGSSLVLSLTPSQGSPASRTLLSLTLDPRSGSASGTISPYGS